MTDEGVDPIVRVTLVLDLPAPLDLVVATLNAAAEFDPAASVTPHPTQLVITLPTTAAALRASIDRARSEGVEADPD